MTLPVTREPVPPRTREGVVLLRSLAETSLRDAIRTIERILSTGPIGIVGDGERTTLAGVRVRLENALTELRELLKV